jgi:hypothetical protein
VVAEDAADEEFALPELVRSLLAAIAKWMRADQGHWRLEFEFQDGHLRRWFRHEGPVGAKERSSPQA